MINLNIENRDVIQDHDDTHNRICGEVRGQEHFGVIDWTKNSTGKWGTSISEEIKKTSNKPYDENKAKFYTIQDYVWGWDLWRYGEDSVNLRSEKDVFALDKDSAVRSL